MDFKLLVNFLKDLDQNNNKDWMDTNRKRYHQIRDSYIEWLDGLNDSLAALDDGYYNTPGKKGINRINNNLMYHPHKPIYKDHMGAGLDKRPNSADFYIEIGIHGSLMAGGLWRPDAKILKSVRDGIDYEGEALKKIINKRSFKSTFGALYEDQKLTNAPKGFKNDHPHIDLLRHKTFAVIHRFENGEVFKNGFNKKLIQVYQEMLPFRRFLNQSITV